MCGIDYDIYKRSRLLSIIQAAAEYFITLLFTTAHLASILNYMNATTAQQGIIASIASLCSAIQFFSVMFVRKNSSVKAKVIFLNIVNQTVFILLYCLPPIGISLGFFIFLFFLAYAASAVYSPMRMSWHLSIVYDGVRGRFTADKEIVSLLGGMLFTKICGDMLDKYTLAGDTETCFYIFAAVIGGLSAINFILLVFIKEPKYDEEQECGEKMTFRRFLEITVCKKQVRTVALICALWNIANVTNMFTGAYITNTLGLSYGFIANLSIVCSLSRALVSRPFGALADRTSWIFMLRLCMCFVAVGFFINIFCVPENGKILFSVFFVIYNASLGGIQSSMTNLMLDYVPRSDRTYAMGINNAFSGICIFVFTCLASVLVDAIEREGNMLFGIAVYPQQLLSAISVLILLFNIFLFAPLLMKNGSCENAECCPQG